MAIAYLIPGFVAFRGIAYWNLEALQLWREAIDGDMKLGKFATLLAIALVLGLILSSFRSASIDHTFRWDWKQRFPILPAYYHGKGRVDPDFTKLIAPGRLAAYQAAETTDKRPYQFYGNMLLALCVLLLGRGLSPAPHLAACTSLLCYVTKVGYVAGCVMGMVGLYNASRTAHWRFARAVEAFNALP